ncbi:hypothetical protein Ciccas_011619 [Cichlidogyrus casuarinus]|uniref:Uncharacterized protein n=1 Tax=Cichlidogyrus casuarinus TaxID=1844966 RepID=A0ABD2PR62_9PLAT
MEHKNSDKAPLENLLGLLDTIHENLRLRPELQRYVEGLERECLEAQASIFEEANRQIQSALKCEAEAKRQALEKQKENAILVEECAALKALVHQLRSGLEGCESVELPPLPTQSSFPLQV